MPGLLLLCKPAAVPQFLQILFPFLDVPLPGYGCVSSFKDVAGGPGQLFSTSPKVSVAVQAPWAMALTEALVTSLLYLFVVHPDGVIYYHYSWWTTEQDVVLLSWTRSLVALVSFFLGKGRRMHV